MHLHKSRFLYDFIIAGKNRIFNHIFCHFIDIFYPVDKSCIL